MATLKQKKLAKAIAENLDSDKPQTMGQVLESVGYSKSVSEAKPGEIIEQQGVQEELAKHGISLDVADSQVGKILREGENMEQLKAADMVYKRLGGYAPDKSININAELTVDEQALDKLTNILNGIHKGASQPGNGTPADALDNEVPNQD